MDALIIAVMIPAANSPLPAFLSKMLQDALACGSLPYAHLHQPTNFTTHYFTTAHYPFLQFYGPCACLLLT